MLCLILYILLIYDSRWWFQQIPCWRDDEGYSPRKIIKNKKPRQAEGELYFKFRHGGPETPPLPQLRAAGSSQTLWHFCQRRCQSQALAVRSRRAEAKGKVCANSRPGKADVTQLCPWHISCCRCLSNKAAENREGYVRWRKWDGR